ncbi:MAG TPA: hypothetical protein VF169_11135 [Albitalea sp.]|uniref:hypothetical protein n=1 Tax=Piscinibacter sp. TaxID=1903157 RepID=UPI002ED3AEE1
MNRHAIIAPLLALSLAGCGGGGLTTVGGTVSGLTSGTAVTLQNNGSDTLVVASNGPFTFSQELSDGDAYSVAIIVQPAGATCLLANPSGTIDNNASKVTNVTVTCTATYLLGGTVSGLGSGESVTLQNNGADPVSVPSNGSFRFPTRVPTGSSYTVTVTASPANKTCKVTNEVGTVQGADVTNVTVTCS